MLPQIRKYLVLIERGSHNHSAFSPDVPSCAATGRTIEETILRMKEALRFHIAQLFTTPEPKGIKHHQEAGRVTGEHLEPGYLITEVEVKVMAKPNTFIEGVHGKSVTFKVLARPRDYVEPKPEMKAIKGDKR